MRCSCLLVCGRIGVACGWQTGLHNVTGVGMSGKQERSLWANAKLIAGVLVQTGKGRFWLAVMLSYGVFGPIILALILPPESEGGFWADLGREWMESGPYSFVGIVLAIFVLVPLFERRRRRKAAKVEAVDE